MAWWLVTCPGEVLAGLHRRAPAVVADQNVLGVDYAAPNEPDTAERGQTVMTLLFTLILVVLLLGFWPALVWVLKHL